MFYWTTFYTAFLLENTYSISSSGKILKPGCSWNVLVAPQPLQNASLPKTGREMKVGATDSWFNFSISISIYFLA